MEGEISSLASDIRSGKMHAFGADAALIFARLDRIRDKQEILVQRHIQIEKILSESMACGTASKATEPLEDEYTVFGNSTSNINLVLASLDDLTLEMQGFSMHSGSPQDYKTST